MEISPEYLSIKTGASSSFLPGSIPLLEKAPLGFKSEYGFTSCLGVSMDGGFGSCCGARSMHGWSGVFYQDEYTEKRKQDFLTVLLRATGVQLTQYFIATDEQLRAIAAKDGPLKLLIEMGAKQVDDTPNQVHGPNKMCLFVWAPNLNKDKLAKYVNFYDPENRSNAWNNWIVEPRWYADLSPEQRKEWFNSDEAKHYKALYEVEAKEATRRAEYKKQTDLAATARNLLVNMRYATEQTKAIINGTGIHVITRDDVVMPSKDVVALKEEINKLKAERNSLLLQVKEGNKVVADLRNKVMTVPKRDRNGRFTKVLLNKGI